MTLPPFVPLPRIARYALLGGALGTALAPPAGREHAAPPVPGLTFNLRVTLRAPTDNGTGNLYLTVHGRSAHGTTRLDPVTVVGPGSPITENEYIIITDTATYSINDQNKTWTEKSVEIGTLNTMTQAVNSGSTISGFSVSLDSLGVGAPVDGRPTQHFRATYLYVTESRTGAVPTVSRYEYWVADLPVALKNPFDGRISPFGAQKARVSEFLPKLLAAWGKMGHGTVVKIVATTANGDQKYTRDVDLTSVKEAEVDDAALAIPVGYTHVAGRGARGGGNPP